MKQIVFALISMTVLMAGINAMAQEVDFLAASRSALDNEILRSPVYTKKVYRAIIVSDQQKYNETLNAINKLKTEGKISPAEYDKRVKLLNTVFNQTHQKSLEQQSADISAHPVEAYYGVAMTTERTNLMKIYHPEWHYENFPFPPKPDEQTKTATTTVNNGNVYAPAAPVVRQKLGQKSFSINLDSFK